MGRRLIFSAVVVLGLVMLLASAQLVLAQTLISSPFTTAGFDGWTDTYDYSSAPAAGAYPGWGVLIDKKVLCENSNGVALQGGITSGGVENDGKCIPYMMVNSAVTSSAYTLTSTMSSTDDDGLGVVFGYQDNDNFFRLTLRRQATGNGGFNQGLVVTKVVDGVITPFIAGPDPSFIGLANDEPIVLKVKVDGPAFEVYASRVAGREPSTPQLSGVDGNLTAGQYGVLSWAQRGGAPLFGTQLHSMTVDNGSDGSIDTTHTFTAASPIDWRRLDMTNADGAQEEGLAHKGNFQLDFLHGYIQDDSNGFEDATTTSVPQSTDFIGPAIVVDEAGSAAMEDVEMKVRITAHDNEGPGLLVRVQDDNTFYRINWASQATGTTRPYQGMSIQKCVANGDDPPVWTDLFHEATAMWNYTNGTPFDVKVTVTNDTGDTSTSIDVEVIDDPDGAATTYAYSTVTDSTTPLLTGTVGLTNWGGGLGASPGSLYCNGIAYSGYGGDSSTPFVVVPAAENSVGGEVPEPGCFVLLLGAVAALAMFRRRNTRSAAIVLLAVCSLAVPMAGVSQAASLITSPFITGYDGWTDTSDPSTVWVGDSRPLWGVLINNDALCDVSDGAQSNGGTYDGGTGGDSQYKPWMIVNTKAEYATPSQYTLTGTLSSTDDDGLGLIFAYQDNDNYCRIGMRQQTTGNFGFAKGISIDKVVNGTITQVAAPNNTFGYSTDNTPFELKVDVNGTACTVTGPDGTSGSPTVYFSGSIPELATLGNHYGFMNWRNQFAGDDAVKRSFGAQLHSLVVDEGSTGTPTRTHTFENASPQPWRELYMTNAEGAQMSLEYDKGNFRVEMAKQGIVDDSNPSENGTATAPHTDFIGSAIMIDNAQTLNLADYEMQVRMECADNEGPGLLVRVQDDDTFYRINFAAQDVDSGNARPWRGMSIQKCDGRGGGTPVWTELYHETTSPFVYTNHTDHGETWAFDVKVKVTNDPTDSNTTIEVEVIDDPDDSAVSYTWAPVVDSSNPILSGTVGLTNWSGGNQDFGRTTGVRWSGYGGDPNAALVVSVTLIPGDTNFDNIVDETDAQVVASHWGDPVTGGPADGDFNGDGVVNATDASIMAGNWGNHNESNGEGEAVPEPSTLLLLLGGLLGLLHVRKRG